MSDRCWSCCLHSPPQLMFMCLFFFSSSFFSWVNVNVWLSSVSIAIFECDAVVRHSIPDHWHPLEPIRFHRYLRPTSIDRNIVALSSDFYNLMPMWLAALVQLRLSLAPLLASPSMQAIYHQSLDRCNCLLCLCSSLAYFGSFGPVYRPAMGNLMAHMVVLSVMKKKKN